MNINKYLPESRPNSNIKRMLCISLLSQEQRRQAALTAREQYLRNIKDGPTKFCTCCGGTWFPSQVSGLNIRTISSKYPNFSLDNAFYLSRKFPSPSGKYQFCSTCRQGVSKGRIPSLCLSNGFDFPEIPECLKILTCLEERLISPRIPFMRIISLGYERQCGIRGAVVNVPISLPDTVSVLLRTFDSTHVIQVHLKRMFLNGCSL